MIVCHHHKYIFIKSRKTAGTSLEIALSQYCGEDDIITAISPRDEVSRRQLGFRGPQHYVVNGFTLMNHSRARRIRSLLGEDIWSSYYKFSIERNPYDKAISLYWFYNVKRERQVTISEFLREVSVTDLSNWKLYTINDAIAVDHVMRYESLDTELKALERRLGIGPLHMIRAKGGVRQDRRSHREVLGPAERALVERVCAKELEHFGYCW